MEQERYSACESHMDMRAAIQQLTETTTVLTHTVDTHSKIANKIFMIALGLMGIAIYAIFYAGALQSQVEHNTIEIEKLEDTVNDHIREASKFLVGPSR